MTDLVHSAAGRPTEEVRRPRAGRRDGPTDRHSPPDNHGSADRALSNTRCAGSIGRLLLSAGVRLLLAVGLALLLLVFVEAWFPSIVVETLGL